ncbi:lipopolysaccharide biosynthesis protein [Halococcus thailandensis]|uniref:Polysaccharide biosynthesis protein n=1 Tax=Halococcus thailandensis JCM 13552 TaxID=1227457 RepID=M0NCT2_9EURY|nr:polysaccharide biosynthesis C-terminal domain-containing protein [Halococcus thailandensis]EMA55373.1 polysaccharide biosynthesis protein [Halococcus thailandensis JCM 13552]
MSRSILRGFVSILGGNVGRTITSLILTPILIRVLGSTEYGKYAFAIALFTPLMTIVNAGIFQGVRRYVGQHPQNDKWRDNIFSFYLRTAIVVAIIATIVLIAISTQEQIWSIFGDELGSTFFILGIMIVPHQLYKLFRGMLMALDLETVSEPIHLLQQVVMKGAGIIFVITGLGATGALLGYGVSLLLASILCLAYIIRNIGIQPLFKSPDPKITTRNLLGFNTLSVVHAFLVGSLLNVDVILIRTFVGSASAGYYKAALVVTSLLWFVPRSLNTVLLHSTASMWENKDNQRISILASRSTRYTLMSTLLLTVGLGTLAEPFIQMYYGREFISTVQPLLLLLPGTVGYALARPVMAIIQSRGNLRLMIAATGAAALLNVLLNVVLIPAYGMSGAAIATSLSYGSMLLFYFVSSATLDINILSDMRTIRILSSAAFTGIVIVPLSSHISSNILSLLIVPPVGMFIYIAALLLLRGIKVDEVHHIYGQITQMRN